MTRKNEEEEEETTRRMERELGSKWEDESEIEHNPKEKPKHGKRMEK
jgi:hypothetical protein